MTTAKLQIDPFFYVFWAIFCLLDQEGLLLYFLSAASIHEAGHVAAIYLCGGQVRRVRLSASGAEIQQARSLGHGADAAIALAGPAAGMAAAWGCSVLGHPTLAGANALLSLFNILPVLPLDGGCVCCHLLQLTPAAQIGTQILHWLSVLMALLLTVSGGMFLIYTGRNATILVIGICLLSSNGTFLRKSCNCGMI